MAQEDKLMVTRNKILLVIVVLVYLKCRDQPRPLYSDFESFSQLPKLREKKTILLHTIYIGVCLFISQLMGLTSIILAIPAGIRTSKLVPSSRR